MLYYLWLKEEKKVKTKLTKKEIAKIEKETVFSVEDIGDGYSFGWYTDAGEDFSFEVSKGEDILYYIKSYCEDFDAEEHALSWVGGRGAPGLFALCDDAKRIEEELLKLREVVEQF